MVGLHESANPLIREVKLQKKMLEQDGTTIEAARVHDEKWTVTIRDKDTKNTARSRNGNALVRVREGDASRSD